MVNAFSTIKWFLCSLLLIYFNDYYSFARLWNVATTIYPNLKCAKQILKHIYICTKNSLLKIFLWIFPEILCMIELISRKGWMFRSTSNIAAVSSIIKIETGVNHTVIFLLRIQIDCGYDSINTRRKKKANKSVEPKHFDITRFAWKIYFIHRRYS